MRLLIVSNRLPFTVMEKNGEFEFRGSVGGLVTGLSAYLDSLKHSSFTELNSSWIGWPGISVKNELKEKLRILADTQFNAYPVFVEEEMMENFYHGFCNKTIWPLFHYFPTFVVYDKKGWNSYKEVNEIFCNSILENLKPDDILWIHDYHLMLLPNLIRQKMPHIPIGFFLHIPFPSYEIFRLLPKKWAKDILEGLLGADLIGFHTHDYTQYFLRCLLRILGYDNNMGQIFTQERTAKADTFPLGIDFNKFHHAVSADETEKERVELKKILVNFKTIISIDRLDYSKGIINRLEGFQLFLKNNPNWHKKVVLLLIVVPSRIGVDKYQDMKTKIDEMVGKINGRFGGIDWSPIIYRYSSIPFHQLVAMYNVSDVALVTPLRDGMNLVSKEYIATRTDLTGVLILSEMAGASKELGEAIIINPNDRQEIADALKEALEMPEEVQKIRNQKMQTRIKNYNVIKWANDFINELNEIKKQQRRFQTRLLDTDIETKIINVFNKANHCLVFLDYDGTLVPFADYPEKATSTNECLELLKKLAKINKVDTVIISGRDKETLQRWFGNLNIGFIAEHGIWIKEKGADWHLIKPVNVDWKSKILPLLNHYIERVPGSFLEEKEYSLTWHYRRADPEQGAMRAKELIDTLIQFTANIDIQILQGSKVIEIRNAGISKANAGIYFLSKTNYDFVLAIGDDLTDEDLFKSLPQTAWTIRVGMVSSHARFNLFSYKDVYQLLKQIGE